MKPNTAREIYEGLEYVESGRDVRTVVLSAMMKESPELKVLSIQETKQAINMAIDIVKQQAQESDARTTRILMSGLRIN